MKRQRFLHNAILFLTLCCIALFLYKILQPNKREYTFIIDQTGSELPPAAYGKFEEFQFDTSKGYVITVVNLLEDSSQASSAYFVSGANAYKTVKSDANYQLLNSYFNRQPPYTPDSPQLRQTTIRVTPVRTRDSQGSKSRVLKTDSLGHLQLLYQDTMIIHYPGRVVLIISKDSNSSELLQSLPITPSELASMRSIADETAISKKMYATLKDPNESNYIITPQLSDSIRMLDSKAKGIAIWEWMVSPQVEGVHTLLLNVYTVTGRGTANYIPTKVIPIYVYAEKASWFSRITVDKDDVKWAILAIAGFIGWVVAKRSARKKDRY